VEAAFAGKGCRRVWRTPYAPDAMDLTMLHAKLGQMAPENDFLEQEVTMAGLLNTKR
jgi:hypothetical protein